MKELIEARKQLKLLMDSETPRRAKDRQVRREQKQTLVDEIERLETLQKYHFAEIGNGVEINGIFGVIIEKMMNQGGLPQLWVCWGDRSTVYPEIPDKRLTIHEAVLLEKDKNNGNHKSHVFVEIE